MSKAPKLRLLWICDGRLDNRLDAATWLSTTQELRLLGCQVTLVAMGPPTQIQIRGVDVLCVAAPDLYFLRKLIYYVQIYGLLLRRWLTTDVLLFHEMSGVWLLPWQPVAHLLFLNKQRPLFVLDTRTVPMQPRERANWRDRLRARIYSLSINMARRWSDGRLAITPRMSQVLQIPDEQLWGIWSSGVDIDLFRSIVNQRSWPSTNRPVQLIYVGSLHYERNLMAFSQAVKQANSEGMSFVFTLIGEGTERRALEDFAATAPESVRVLRPVPHNEIPHLLAQAHIGVLPFPDEERFRVSSPIKLFEYMAAGLPILTTRIDCHTDVVGIADYAFWAEDSSVDGLLQALRQVWAAKETLAIKGAQAAQASTAWSWKAVANDLKNALEYGLKTQGRRPGRCTNSVHDLGE